MSQYSQTIRYWATDTSRAGILENADGTGEVGLDGADSGSRIAARFTLKVELGRVADIRYQVFGCGYSMAACAVAADLSIGYTLQELSQLNAIRIDDALDGLPDDRKYCADLAAEALNAAVVSAETGRKMVSASINGTQDSHARVNKDNPVYSLLTGSNCPPSVSEKDRHLFACLIAVASQEPYNTHEALGLTESDLIALLRVFFPATSYDALQKLSVKGEGPAPEINEDVLGILLQHLPACDNEQGLMTSKWLCDIISARAAQTGHLWVSMGLFERPDLTASIKRHLPSLIEANHQNMRWKRFLFKQVCDNNGGTMCKTPNCGECSDYALCFVEED